MSHDTRVRGCFHCFQISDRISAWFYKTLAGILPDPEQPGFKHVIVKPWPVEDLTWVKGEICTPYGRVRSEWHREEDRFVLNVSIPPNSSATVHLPAADPSEVLESGRPAQKSEHVSFCEIERGRAVYDIGAGSYRFELDVLKQFPCDQLNGRRTETCESG